MAMRRSAVRAARPAATLGPAFAVLVALIASAAALYGLTYGLGAWTLDQRRDARIADGTLRLPALDARNQSGQPLRLFGGSAPGQAAPHLYIVDFIYTRCPTVCRALGAEFAQLRQQIEADGMTERIRLVSLSFDPRDTIGDLAGYARTHGARTPGWDVATATPMRAMDQLLRDADVIAIPDGLGGFEHNGGLHVVDADGAVLAIYPLERFREAYADARARARGLQP